MGVSKVILGNDVLMDITDTTAVENRIFYPYTAYGADGDQMVGTYSGGSVQRYNIAVVENQDGTQTLNITDAVDGAYFIVFDILEDGTQRLYISDAGSGGSSEPNLQSKTVSYTPSETAQSETVTADSGYDGLSSVAVSVGAVSSTYVGSGILRKSSTDLTASGATVTVPAGYYSAAASKSVASGTAGVPTATKGAVQTSRITITPTVTNTAGYITGGTINGDAITVTARELVEGTVINIDEPGTWDVAQAETANVPTGVVVPPSSISGTSATVTTGTNTLTLTKTVSVTPSVSNPGYVTAGTAGNASVSLTASVTTKAAATITPTKSTQTIASGTYLTGTQTIAAIPAAYQDVTGVTAAAGDVVSGKSIVDSSGNTVNGSLVIQHYYTGSGTPSSSTGVNGDIYLKTS